MAKIRMAQYGTKHGHAIGKLMAMQNDPDVELVGVFEPDIKRRKELETGALDALNWFDEPDQMLADSTILAVASEGSNAESLDQTEAIVEANKHVWYDKPAGDNWLQWKRVVDLAKGKELLIQMGYMLRYHSAFRQVTEWAKSGFLGHIFSVRAHMSTALSAEARRRIQAHQGGIFYDLGGHMLDQVLWLLGYPGKVTAFLRNDSDLVPDFTDNSLVVLEFDQAMAMIDIAATEPQPMARRFEVYGDQGSAIITEPFEPGNHIRLCLSRAKGGYSTGEQSVTIEGEGRQRLYELELEAFLATIAGEQAPDRPRSHELLVQETLLRATSALV